MKTKLVLAGLLATALALAPLSPAHARGFFHHGHGASGAGILALVGLGIFMVDTLASSLAPHYSSYDYPTYNYAPSQQYVYTPAPVYYYPGPVYVRPAYGY